MPTFIDTKITFTSQNDNSVRILTLFALILGIPVGVTTFTVNCCVIIKSLYDFNAWVREKRRKNNNPSNDPEGTGQAEAATTAAITTAQAATRGVPRDIQAAGIPDPNDPSTYLRVLDSNGKNVQMPDKQDVFQACLMKHNARPCLI